MVFRKTVVCLGVLPVLALASGLVACGHDDGASHTVGQSSERPCRASQMSERPAISAGTNHTVGLRSDGTAVAVGDNYE